MVFFTSDTHFGHENIIRFCNRPYSDTDTMNEALIASWNARVKPTDTVFIVGDMFYRCRDVELILKKLRGRKRLIIGNHDSSWMSEIDLGKYFVSVSNMLETSDGKHALTLCHYPMLSWRHEHRAYMVHGHIHNDTTLDYFPLLAVKEHILNAGTDINGYQPVTFDEMLENNAIHKQRFLAQQLASSLSDTGADS